ncbi:cytochrome c-type biogenesis protein [Patulibacter defluvii]|uniref:cytochrome c-type biogenesis protein n=1 Tax=Patulibacter defluvii TaxID=3095358 RepID=UPI002A751046|nr:cytochrome c-type biogenesis protein CcmH [Patulibacter sp. DM4]
MSRRLPLRLLAALLALVAAPAAAVAAPTPAQQQQVAREAESRLMCVTCNTPLNQSEATQANRERTEIERLAARGLNADQVVDRMVEIYGENVLIDPPDDTVRLLRWLLPALGALAAAALLTVLVRRWRRRRSVDDDAPFSPATADDAPAPAEDAPSGEDARRLDADLARYR